MPLVAAVLICFAYPESVIERHQVEARRGNVRWTAFIAVVASLIVWHHLDLLTCRLSGAINQHFTVIKLHL